MAPAILDRVAPGSGSTFLETIWSLDVVPKLVKRKRAIIVPRCEIRKNQQNPLGALTVADYQYGLIQI